MEMDDTLASLSLIFVLVLQTKKNESSIWWKIFEHSLAPVCHKGKKQGSYTKHICTFSEG